MAGIGEMVWLYSLGQRVGEAAQRWPDRSIWLLTVGWLGLYAAFAVPWAWGRLLRWEPVRSPGAILSNASIALIFPALFEEILFRVLPLPLSDRSGAGIAWDTTPDLWIWTGLSLLVFILAHPLNAWLIFPDRRTTFYNPTFLTLAGFLGLICTLAYLQSGSLWPPVLIHWLVVVVWLLLLGGCQRLGFLDPS
ncbi:MAG: type II CAAX prenyl endopeptidase Rce1 family protein [Prochlorothrix sp.]|nr:CPBP family glutamic-type intramembrane protease [Prochlorothrix sp.]